MGYQILFTDLDGTLLNSRGGISEANKNAARKATAAGKRIVLCSGRSWRSLAFYEEELGLNKPGHCGVSFNGGVVYAHVANGGMEREIIFERTLPNALGQRLITRLKELNGDLLVYAGDGLYAEQPTLFSKEYGKSSKLTIHMVDDFADIKNNFINIMKILAGGMTEDLQQLYQNVYAEFSAEAYMVFSSPVLLEFGPKAAHKGNGIEILARHLHIPLEEVIAMGDESNDLTMLKTAGLGIAVANAVDGAKAAAKVVSPYSNDEDAFARVIEEYLL